MDGSSWVPKWLVKVAAMVTVAFDTTATDDTNDHSIPLGITPEIVMLGRHKGIKLARVTLAYTSCKVKACNTLMCGYSIPLMSCVVSLKLYCHSVHAVSVSIISQVQVDTKISEKNKDIRGTKKS